MTGEQLRAAKAGVDGPRDEVACGAHLGIPYTLWRSGAVWYAAARGVDGFGVAEDRQSALELVKYAIEDGDHGPDDEHGGGDDL